MRFGVALGVLLIGGCSTPSHPGFSQEPAFDGLISIPLLYAVIGPRYGVGLVSDVSLQLLTLERSHRHDRNETAAKERGADGPPPRHRSAGECGPSL